MKEQEVRDVIEINHLVKKYGNHVAVDDLTLKVEPGKIYGFLGPNGAGKSTTMNMITGYLGATSGEIKINGFDIFKQPEQAKRCIGYLPEIPPLHQDMTVREYLDYVSELKQLDKKSRKAFVEEAMEMTKITDVSERLIRNLSKGYKQRVGLAQAILGYPDIIILDEPTVGLDPMQIIEIRELIKELGEKHTVILSSHILTEISAVCNHVFIISKGKLVASNSTENLLSLMAGAQEIEMLIKGNLEEATTAFEKLDEIEKLELLEENEPGMVHMNLIAQKNQDIRELVYHTCVANQMPILEMRPVTKSLEDVFLELTSKEASEENVAENEEGYSEMVSEEQAEEYFEEEAVEHFEESSAELSEKGGEQ